MGVTVTSCPVIHRSVQILPNQLLGCVGEHSSGFPVETTCLSHDKDYLISSCQEACHFWPTVDIPSLPPEEGEGEGPNSKRKKRRRKQKHRDLAQEELARTKKQHCADFYADLCN